ncbi:hypothetical protein AVEN_61206-1 [Araneus ventricosus]|uniref:Uncharacterized protein n=1 Tax=Araneus ventricosus TaxID=182803 RepID=A0A4Y2L647_ARAVE|nr:hypothetical protein AVEN_61206-1 [Araneus ventricosus]
MLDATQNDGQFPVRVLFSDETCFTRESVFNTLCAYVVVRKFHITVSSDVQHKFSNNIWAGILGDHLLGPYLLPERLNGTVKYLVFLQHVLPDLLQGIPTNLRQNM